MSELGFLGLMGIENETCFAAGAQML